MKNNLNDLTDDELSVGLIDSLDYMGKEDNAQLIICIFLVIYSLLGFLNVLSLNIFWYSIQVLCWGLYLRHKYRYKKKEKIFNLYKKEMVKRKIL